MTRQDGEMQDRIYPVDEDIALQRRIWRFERVGWYVLLIIVVLTLGGLFSHGPLSTVSATSAQQDLTVEFERFHRGGAVNSMVIHGRGTAGQPLAVSISEVIMKGFTVESMQPQPISSIGTKRGLKLLVPTDETGAATLYLAWRADGVGLFQGRISIDGGGEVAVTQFIYP